MLVWPCSMVKCARLVVHEPERHQQRRDEFEAAAEVIDVARPGERRQRPDGDGRRRSSRGPPVPRRPRAPSDAAAGSSLNGRTDDVTRAPMTRRRRSAGRRCARAGRRRVVERVVRIRWSWRSSSCVGPGKEPRQSSIPTGTGRGADRPSCRRSPPGRASRAEESDRVSGPYNGGRSGVHTVTLGRRQRRSRARGAWRSPMTRDQIEPRSRARCWRGPRSSSLIEHGHGQSPAREVREQVLAYLDELRTTQRYPFYRALQHPLYPILRKIDAPRRARRDRPATRSRTDRVIYASNHRSHIDYLVEPLVLDDNGIRPPLIAAGINLFGGPLGLHPPHVTGAIPIRRNTKDPVYLTTLKAYIAELLQRPRPVLLPRGRAQLQRRDEAAQDRPAARRAAGRREGRAASCRWRSRTTSCSRTARIARQGVKKRQRPFTHELAEMVGAGGRLPLAGVRHLRRADPAGRLRSRVAPGRARPGAPSRATRSAGSTRCCRRRSSPARCGRRSRARDLESRVDAALDRLQAAGANLAVRDAKHAVEDGVAAPRAPRRASRREGGPPPRARPQRAALLRPDRSSTCCRLVHTIGPDHAGRPLEVVLPRAGPEQGPRAAGLARTAWPRPPASRAASSPARPPEEAIEAATAIQAKGMLLTLDQLGESITTLAEAEAATSGLPRAHREDRARPASTATSR